MEKRNISDREAEEQVWKYAGRVSEKDVREMASKADRISGFFVHVEVLRKYLDDATTIFALLKDRVAGRYAHTPWRTVSALTAALLYVLTPLDVIADFIPFAGYVDDAAVFAFALHFARFDLDAYRDWKRSREAGNAETRQTAPTPAAATDDPAPQGEKARPENG